MPSLPTVSVKVIADIEKYVADFKRAENVARRTASNIDRELTDLAKKTSKKFQLGDIGKDVMKGAGIFGGFQIAQTAAEFIAKFWSDAADSAKLIEATSLSSLTTARQIADLKRTDDENSELRIKELDLATRKMQAAISNRKSASGIQGWISGGGVDVETAKGVNETTEAYNKLAVAVAVDENKRRNITEEMEKQLDLAERARLAAIERSGISPNKIGVTTGQAIEGLTARKATLEGEISALAIASRALPIASDNSAEGNMARDLVIIANLKKRTKLTQDLTAIEERLPVLYDRLAKQNAETTRIVGLAADGMAAAWVDSLKGVEGAWANLGDVIITEIMRVAAQILIVRPLINGLGRMMGGGTGGTGAFSLFANSLFSYGKPAADGGFRDGSKPYLVGEKGPEIFAPGSAGTIIPNHRLGGAGGGGGGGGDTIVVNQSYNIGAGVTASQLMPILAMQKRAILGTIADARRRRTSLGAALA